MYERVAKNVGILAGVELLGSQSFDVVASQDQSRRSSEKPFAAKLCSMDGRDFGGLYALA